MDNEDGRNGRDQAALGHLVIFPNINFESGTDSRLNFEKAFYSKYMFFLFGLPLVALLVSKR